MVKKKRDRSMLMKLRGGTAALQIEIGRWRGIKREEGTCKECQNGEVEDVYHWLLQCPTWDHLRQPLIRELGDRNMNRGSDVKKQTASILSLACSDKNILRYIRRMWGARFKL